MAATITLITQSLVDAANQASDTENYLFGERERLLNLGQIPEAQAMDAEYRKASDATNAAILRMEGQILNPDPAGVPVLAAAVSELKKRLDQLKADAKKLNKLATALNALTQAILFFKIF